MKENNKVGERITNRRKELGLTLKELSEKSSISIQLISDYEKGRKEPGVKNILLLCNALNVYPNYLLLEDDPHAPTYGNALDLYLSALEMSNKDKLIVDEKNNKVNIEINDEIIKNCFIMINRFKDSKALSKTIKNFNVNILKDKKIKNEQ